jgi:hypothetical protein
MFFSIRLFKRGAVPTRCICYCQGIIPDAQGCIKRFFF